MRDSLRLLNYTQQSLRLIVCSCGFVNKELLPQKLKQLCILLRIEKMAIGLDLLRLMTKVNFMAGQIDHLIKLLKYEQQPQIVHIEWPLQQMSLYMISSQKNFSEQR